MRPPPAPHQHSVLTMSSPRVPTSHQGSLLLQPVGLGKRMTRTHHQFQTEEFHRPKEFPCASPLHPSSPGPCSHGPVPVSTAVPSPESPVAGVTQDAAFSDRLPSLSDTHLWSLRVSSWRDGSFPLSAGYSPVDRMDSSVSVHPLKSTLVASECDSHA